MKKYLILISVALAFASCTPKTELAVKNSSSSDGSIEDIMWAGGDASWSDPVGLEQTTDSKEVSELDGSITCSVDAGGSLEIADVVIQGQTGDSISLNDGESQTVTVTATGSGTSASLRR